MQLYLGELDELTYYKPRRTWALKVVIKDEDNDDFEYSIYLQWKVAKPAEDEPTQELIDSKKPFPKDIDDRKEGCLDFVKNIVLGERK